MSADNFLIFRETKNHHWRVYERQMSGSREYLSFRTDEEIDDYLKDYTFEKCLEFHSLNSAEDFTMESGMFTEYGNEVWKRLKR